MDVRLPACLAVILLAVLNGAMGAKKEGTIRQKRQSFTIAQYITRAFDEANRELEEQKSLDRLMLERGIDIPSGSKSYFWHLGRFLYTKNKELVEVLSDKAWVTVRATKKLVDMSGISLVDLMNNPEIVNEWRRQVEMDCPFKFPVCDFTSPYRTADGSCNNQKDTTLGAAFTRQRRMMLNSYDDGIDYPRSQSYHHLPLPSPRQVSNTIHKSDECPLFNNRITVMVMQFGQFIEHDVISTPMITGTDGADIMCCDSPPHITARRHACFPIHIPQNDERFHEPCMTFVRSTPGLKLHCDMGVRSPMNQASAFMDGSQIYGTSAEETWSLRAGVRGMMNITKQGLPPHAPGDEEMCIKEEPGDYCMLAGDFRVNHVPGLTVMHTAFLREHNRIAKHLCTFNPHWDDETVFQITRKIIIAMLQHMVYTELLPLILNDDHMTRYSLKSQPMGLTNSYDPNEDASIMMGFSSAAMRFPHTRIPNVQSMVDSSFQARADAQIFETFDKPKFVLQKFGRAISDFGRWLTSFPAMQDDRFVESGVRDNLFLDESGRSFDLVSLNIQRARDQGVPPYNEWRKLCGLPPANYFAVAPGGLVDHTPEVAMLLQSVYNDVNDIDLFTGGLSETILENSAVGPTFACIIATQFKTLKFGDRFWYENNLPRTGFSLEQVNELKKIRLSKILCMNLDVPMIQPNVFRFADDGANKRMPCAMLPEIDIEAFEDPRL